LGRGFTYMGWGRSGAGRRGTKIKPKTEKSPVRAGKKDKERAQKTRQGVLGEKSQGGKYRRGLFYRTEKKKMHVDIFSGSGERRKGEQTGLSDPTEEGSDGKIGKQRCPGGGSSGVIVGIREEIRQRNCIPQG